VLNKKIKKLSLIVLVISAVLGLAFFVSKTQAGTGENGLGWLWGGSDDGGAPLNNTGIGWVSMNNTTGGGANSYGVNIPATDGAVTGYAWSENVGWISFNSADIAGCPDGNCVAQRSGNNLTGWARIVGIETELAAGNSGGWQGWIKLNGTGYGVDITKMDGTGNNKTYAWSDELGWIDFSKASLNVTYSLKICYDCTNSSSRLGSLALIKGSSYNAKACKVVSTEATCNGTDLTSAAGISWTSDNNTNVSVDNSSNKGKITGNEIGPANVNVSDSVSGLSDTLNVTVNPVSAYCGDRSCNGGENCSPTGNENSNGGQCFKDCGKCVDANWREVSPN